MLVSGAVLYSVTIAGVLFWHLLAPSLAIDPILVGAILLLPSFAIGIHVWGQKRTRSDLEQGWAELEEVKVQGKDRARNDLWHLRAAGSLHRAAPEVWERARIGSTVRLVTAARSGVSLGVELVEPGE
jgi:hypothetical protein